MERNVALTALLRDNGLRADLTELDGARPNLPCTSVRAMLHRQRERNFDRKTVASFDLTQCQFRLVRSYRSRQPCKRRGCHCASARTCKQSLWRPVYVLPGQRHVRRHPRSRLRVLSAWDGAADVPRLAQLCLPCCRTCGFAPVQITTHEQVHFSSKQLSQASQGFDVACTCLADTNLYLCTWSIRRMMLRNAQVA